MERNTEQRENDGNRKTVVKESLYIIKKRINAIYTRK